jgi:hypothetical protein
MRCLYYFDEDTSEKQIVVLLRNYEFLKWQLTPTIIGNLSPFQLFKQHYLEAKNILFLHDDPEVVSEIFEAWECSDMNVREEYEKLCPLQNWYDRFAQKSELLSEIMRSNKLSAPQSEAKRSDFSNKVLVKANY